MRKLQIIVLVFPLLAPLVGVLTAGNENTDSKKLQGTWEIVDAVSDGAKRAPKKGPTKIAFAGDQMRSILPDDPNETESLRFKLDPSKKPATIDFHKKFGDEERGPICGIYLLEGDTLKLCIARLPGDERPKAFDAPKRSSAMLLTLKRGKK